jgi:hypothetical protein
MVAPLVQLCLCSARDENQPRAAHAWDARDASLNKPLGPHVQRGKHRVRPRLSSRRRDQGGVPFACATQLRTALVAVPLRSQGAVRMTNRARKMSDSGSFLDPRRFAPRSMGRMSGCLQFQVVFIKAVTSIKPYDLHTPGAGGRWDNPGKRAREESVARALDEVASLPRGRLGRGGGNGRPNAELEPVSLLRRSPKPAMGLSPQEQVVVNKCIRRWALCRALRRWQTVSKAQKAGGR